MNILDFVLGGMSVIMAYALFTSDEDDELEQDEINSNVVVNDFSRKLYPMSCQTCRKMKNHREVEERVYECTKCKRRTDVRTS